MQITNNYNLPAPLVSAIVNDTYEKVGDISVTRLISAPRKHQLENRHDAEITQDVTDFLWSLLGQSVHEIFRRTGSIAAGYLVEKRLSAKVSDWIISGQLDLVTPEGILQDWKVTSVWSFLLGDKPDWEAQLNCYAWLLGKGNWITPKGLQIVGILRDWQQSKAGYNVPSEGESMIKIGDCQPGYPPVPFVIKDIPLWSKEVQQRYVEKRVAIHQFAANTPDDELPECTDEERWARSTTWAVKKKGNKKAARVLASEAEAVTWIAGAKGFEIEERPGRNIRCEKYCAAAPFCNQWKAMSAPSVAPEDADIPF